MKKKQEHISDQSAKKKMPSNTVIYYFLILQRIIRINNTQQKIYSVLNVKSIDVFIRLHI